MLHVKDFRYFSKEKIFHYAVQLEEENKSIQSNLSQAINYIKTIETKFELKTRSYNELKRRYMDLERRFKEKMLSNAQKEKDTRSKKGGALVTKNTNRVIDTRSKLDDILNHVNVNVQGKDVVAEGYIENNNTVRVKLRSKADKTEKYITQQDQQNMIKYQRKPSMNKKCIEDGKNINQNAGQVMKHENHLNGVCHRDRDLQYNRQVNRFLIMLQKLYNCNLIYSFWINDDCVWFKQRQHGKAVPAYDEDQLEDLFPFFVF